MKPPLRRLVAVLTAVVVGPVALPSVLARPPAAAAPVPAPAHSVEVGGAGTTTFPDFDPGVARYGVTTTDATGGTLTVRASTTDPGGQVLVDGRVAAGGSRTLTGLQPGDEVAVWIVDSAGTARHSFVYLPSEFPRLERVTPDPAPGSVQPGAVLLTLSQYVRPAPPDLAFFETAVDLNGVPLFVRRTPRSMDLQRQPGGPLTVFRGPAASGPAGEELVVLDEAGRAVATRRTVGLVNTDGHDAILEPDGDLWLMAYEPRSSAPGAPVDAVIQRIDPSGRITFQWTSEPYEADAVRDVPDYAHVNSFQVMADGDLLVSFRHFSSVFKIATSAHDGFEVGDVVWKLGGRDSDFDFAAGDLGPCAQHTARELPDGHVLMFDNGSWNGSTSWCIDPADRAGPPVQRVQTRVVEYALDTAGHRASVVQSHEPPGRFAVFAGSAQRLPNGNTLVGWAEDTTALVTELAPDGTPLWELRDPRPEYPYFSYRAAKAAVPDVVPPTATLAVGDGATYVEGVVVPVGAECTDRGGSGLQTCVAPETLDTSTPGERTVTVAATDGAGNHTEVTRRYRVVAATGLDVAVRARGGSTWVGAGQVGPVSGQQLHTRLRERRRAVATVRVTNLGTTATGVTLDRTSRGRGFRLSRSPGELPVLQPGQSTTLRVVVTPRTERARRFLLTLVARTTSGPVRSDGVRWTVRAGR